MGNMSTYQRTDFVTSVCFVLLFAVAGPAAAQEEVGGWGIRNGSMPYHSSSVKAASERVAWNGACYGMVYAEVLFRRMGLHEERSFTEATTPAATRTARFPEESAAQFSEQSSTRASDRDQVRSRIDATSDQILIEQFALLAQNYAHRDRDMRAEVLDALPDDPAVVAASFRSSEVSPDNPQIMVLHNRTSAHAVVVEGMAEDDRVITYRIKDPNYPGEERRIQYDKTTGEYTPYDGYTTIQHDVSELPEANRRALENLVERGTDPENPALPVWSSEPKTRSLQQEIPAPKPVPNRALKKQMSYINQGQVGGVALSFDPVLVESSSSDRERWEMLRDVTEAMTAGEESVLAQEARDFALKAVPLSKILDDGDYWVSYNAAHKINRIHGYMTREGDDELYLLGLYDPDFPPFSIDILTVALDEIWRQGRSPAVSLDPDPMDFFGDQHVRLEDISEQNSRTDFTRVMLEADYRMKQVLFAQGLWDLPEFTTVYDLIQESPGAEMNVQSRYWLFPRESAGADAWVIRQDDVTTVFFESDVKVLTENELDAMNFAFDDVTDPLREQAALSFTAHYDKIAAQYPVFQELDALFGMAKLAAILRARDVDHPDLDRAVSRYVPAVEIPDTYAGIGPIWVEGTPYFIGGGCQLRRRLIDPRVQQYSPVITEMAEGDGTGNLSLVVSVPAMISLEDHAAVVSADLELHQALVESMRGEYAAASDRLDRLSELVPADDEQLRNAVLIYQSLARLSSGDASRALVTINNVQWDDPSVISLRSLIRLYAGDPDGAYRDALLGVASDKKAGTFDANALQNLGIVQMMTMRWGELDRTLEQLDKIAPADPGTAMLKQSSSTMRKLGDKKAAVRIEQYLAVPFPVTAAFEAGYHYGLNGDYNRAIRQLEQGLTVLNKNPGAPDDAYMRERLWLGLVTLYDKRIKLEEGQFKLLGIGHGGDMDRRADILAEFVETRPDWITGWALRLAYGSNEEEDEVFSKLDDFRHMMTLDPADDPLLVDLENLIGSEPQFYCGLVLVPNVIKSLTRTKPEPSVLDDFEYLLTTLSGEFETGPVLHYLNTARDFGKMMNTMLEIVDEFSEGRDPEDVDEDEFKAELARRLDVDPRELFSGEWMGKKLARMPPPRDGDGLPEIFVLSRFWVEPFTEMSVLDLKGMLERPDTDWEEVIHELGDISRDLRKGMAMIDVEWNSFQAYQGAARINILIQLLHAEVMTGALASHPDWALLRGLALNGVIGPRKFLAAATDTIIGEVIAVPDDLTSLATVFTKARLTQVVTDFMREMAFEWKETAESFDEHDERYKKAMKMGAYWLEIRHAAITGDYSLVQFFKEIPLDSPLDIFTAKEFISIQEKNLSGTDPARVADDLRELTKAKAHLEARLEEISAVE